MARVRSIAISGLCVVLAGCGASGNAPVVQASMDDTFAVELAGPLVGASVTGQPEVSVNDADFGSLVNGIRREDGQGVVTYNRQLNSAAQGHADDMLARNYFSHISQDGRTVEDRIRAEGYDPVAWGENIAQGFNSNAAVLEAWQNSPAHRRLLLADTVDEFGLGVSGSGASARWVLVMAAD